MGYRDLDLEDQVRASLRKSGEFSPLRLDIAVRNGIVYLAGEVPISLHPKLLETVRAVNSVAAVVDKTVDV